MPPELKAAKHGKARVRVAKVTRGTEKHDIIELTVLIELHGGTDSSFTAGDNRLVVATDTCKNHVYMLAKNHPMSCPEQFALALGKQFVEEYSHVQAVRIMIKERPWKRFEKDGVPHAHGFVLSGDGIRMCDVFMNKDRVVLQSGLQRYDYHSASGPSCANIAC